MSTDIKCPCCENPWAVATGDFFANLCGECEAKTPNTEGIGLSRANMDFAVSPSDNFYLYASGTWMKENPIPAGYPSWNTFTALHVKSQEDLKELLLALNDKESLTADEAKVKAFYEAAMNEQAIELAGINPIQPILDLCDAASEACKNQDKATFAEVIGKFVSLYGISNFFCIGASPDNKNSNHSICQMCQGGIGLPDRDYYFDEDKADKRDAYKMHVAKMLSLLLDPDSKDATEDSIASAASIFDLELKLAEAHMTKTENRDPLATYNKMSCAELSEKCHNTFDFDAYFRGATGKPIEELGEINVRHVAAIERMTQVVSTVDPDVLCNYLRWGAVKCCSSYMSKSFVNESFDFYEKILSGTQELKPRWKRAMAFTESALGEALGQMYCAAFFDESSKGRALTIVENVRMALEERLKEVNWMTSDSTRDAALKKMSRFKVKIGYPDEWIDYTSLEIIAGDDFLSMVLKSRAFQHSRELKEMNAPTDTKKWFMTPQTVNAYYHPNLNEIVFPAAILRPPFFDQNADDAVNYGAMGAVVGHEMTHGFDDKGRKFNSDGNMVDWWTDADSTEYEKRVNVMVKQANDFVVHGQSVQGKLTCGENIADLGGLRLAYRALKAQDGFDSAPLLDGFTPTQRFFLSWAQAWRQNITKERSLQLITLDPHGPNEMRANGPLSNMEEFLQAFSVSSDSPMYKPVESRVDIW